MKKAPLSLFGFVCLVSLACQAGGLFAPTPTPIPTKTPTRTLRPTALPTNTALPTSTPQPTATPLPTPTTYPLSSEETLAQIVLQKGDLLEFFQEIGIKTEGFVDGSLMGITQVNSFELPNFTHWQGLLPPGIVSSYSTIYTTQREFTDRLPTFIAFHTATIFVFPNPEEAHAFFTEDIQSVDPEFKKALTTLGDESLAFSCILEETGRDFGAVMWRYREVYVFVSAQLNYEVSPDTLVKIAQNIQDRLLEAAGSASTP